MKTVSYSGLEFEINLLSNPSEFLDYIKSGARIWTTLNDLFCESRCSQNYGTTDTLVAGKAQLAALCLAEILRGGSQRVRRPYASKNLRMKEETGSTSIIMLAMFTSAVLSGNLTSLTSLAIRPSIFILKYVNSATSQTRPWPTRDAVALWLWVCWSSESWTPGSTN
ncbi:hypothetical protein BD289DRAFT_87014 [Coniella lustricola]|uniref:Uncharacterized protein n=1 Tax=Coniella lustricola TaxID=2025994 RepID=A0A2T2ZYN6_9PEZI|nr:hypothetical protein BD289DRAFT_87014 [Coniella lustricola]